MRVDLQVAAKETIKTISHFCLLSNIVYGGSGVVALGAAASRALSSVLRLSSAAIMCGVSSEQMARWRRLLEYR